MQQLVLQPLLGFAAQGLQQFGLDESDIRNYLGVIRARVETGQHGAAWQRRYHDQYRCDMQTLTAVYVDRQQTGKPVHEWVV